MGVRFLFIGTLPLCLVSSVDCAHAQAAYGNSEVLPAIEVVAPTTAAKPARSRGATQSQALRNVRRVLVYPTAPTPTARSGMDVDKVPAAINAVGAAQIARTDSLNITDALQQHVPGLIISDTTGNPFMPGIQFRGFDSSPVAGTPQGLAVYQNGMRINEAFGDTVNWDLIPTAAIRSVTVVTNNPAFGLNALGGAVNVLMKARSDASRVRRNMASRLTIGRSMAHSKACVTTAIAIFRNRRSGASMATSVTGPIAASFISTSASPKTILARRQPFRSNCCRNIGGPPIRRRRPPTTVWPTPI
jgi:outer membrane receptor for Fe3+-dicitrate